MSFNGSGVYTLPGPQLASGETVSATENNQFRNDVEGAFNVTFCRDGEALPTANWDMNGFKLTGLPAGTTNGDSVRYEQVTSDVAITGGTIAGATISTPAPITSTVSTGTAPFVIASTTVVTNLNADKLDGYDWAEPPEIGSSTPNSALFTNLFSDSYTSKNISIPLSDIDLSAATFFSITIASDTEFTVSNIPASGIAASFVLDITNGGTSNITWWPNIQWQYSTVPTLTFSGRDVLGFFTYDNGSTWTGLVLAKDVG